MQEAASLALGLCLGQASLHPTLSLSDRLCVCVCNPFSQSAWCCSGNLTVKANARTTATSIGLPRTRTRTGPNVLYVSWLRMVGRSAYDFHLIDTVNWPSRMVFDGR